MAVELSEILDGIMEAKKLTQAELGERIGASQSVVSKMKSGPDWKLHWQIFLKLLPLCVELDLIRERDLLPARHDQESTQSHSKARSVKAHPRG